MVECGGLENRCAARHRGFKSYFLRHILFAPFYERGIFILNAIELRRSAETAQTSRSAMTLRVILAAREALNHSAWPKANASLFRTSRTRQNPARCFVQLWKFINALSGVLAIASSAKQGCASPSSTSASNEQPSGFGREALLAKTSA